MIKAEWTNKDALDLQPTCNQLATAEPKTGRDCTDFMRWLMDAVLDFEDWRMNADAYGEVICRKLKKLGLLDVVDGYYVETQETRWIPVSEALPSKGQVVLAIGDKGTWDVGKFQGTAFPTDDERWNWKKKTIKHVKYWMPKDAIPLPYREDGEA